MTIREEPNTYETLIPQRYNPLFTGGKDTNLNACVGDNGGPYDLADYGDGFFCGGQSVVSAAKAMTYPVDVLVYPATFCFRHGIELYLKRLIEIIDAVLSDSKGYGKVHRIDQLWGILLERHALLEKPMVDKERVDLAGTMIGYFHEIDPTGQVFRYPEDIRGNLHLKDHRLINVRALADHMVKLHELLKEWYYRGLDVLEARGG